MANPSHQQMLQRSVEEWNAWRAQHRDIIPDLKEADLRGSNLIHANLINANLYHANLGATLVDGPRLRKADLTGAILKGADLLGADLSFAILTGATLCEADLRGAKFTLADLSSANLSEASLSGADLIGANLAGADFSKVYLYETVFGDTNLTAVRGLETCDHGGPSTLDHRTLAKSGPLPLTFLRGCGLNDWEIKVAKLYDSGLTAGQVNDILYCIYPLRTNPLIQFNPCFISYASQDLQRIFPLGNEATH